MKSRLLVLFLLISIFRTQAQCSLSVDLTSTNSVICSGTPVTLIATASAGTPGYTYAWNTGESTSSIQVNKAGTYTVSVKDNSASCPAVVKSITLTDGTTPSAPIVADQFVCPNSSATITASGSSGIYQWYDAPTGGNFLATGATYTTRPITNTTTYYVETTVNGCASARSAVTLTALVVSASGNTTCPGSTTVLTANGAADYVWYDAPGGRRVGTGKTFTTPPLSVTTDYYVVGTTNACVSQPIKATATVQTSPPPPTANDVTTCYNNVATLHATSNPGDIFDWYTTPTGGTSLISSPDYTTPPLTANTRYYVQITTPAGCVSARTPVNVTVNTVPAIPTAADVVSCTGSTATLKATAPTGDFNWYATASSTTVIGTGNIFVTPTLSASTDFYVEAVNGTCVSPRKAIHVTVNAPPTAPTASGQTVCSGSSAVLTALGPGGTYSWYDAATGGNLLFTGNAFTTPALTTNTTYYVETLVGNCTSTRKAVVVTVNLEPSPPAAADVSICSGSTATLTASGSGSVFEWYSAATGGTPLGSTATFVTPALTATTTYYVQTTDNGCISQRKAVTVTVNPSPIAPTAAGKTICAGNTATLTASGTGTIQWYSAASGGTPLATGSSYTTPTLSATTTYFVSATSGTCESSRTAVAVTVQSGNNQFKYASSTYCKSGTVNPVPAITNTGGTFSATPAGLSLSATTGEIDLATSLLNNYTIIYTNGCAISTQKVSIVLVPDASFSYSASTYCQDSANPAPQFTALSSPGVFSSTAGLVFINATSGVIDLKASTPGTYTITNTIDGAGGCPTVAATTTVKIDQSVSVSAGPNQTVASGVPVQLAGNISGAVSTGAWSGGTGTFSNTTDVNATYTPGAGETSAVLTLTSANPGTTCGPQTSSVTITFIAKPAAPVAANTTACSGSSTTLTVAPPLNGIYEWFTVPTGGTPIATGDTYITLPLTASTTYYVQTTVSGVASDRTAVIVTVTPTLAAPTVQPTGPICYGTQATLTATGPGGNYQWYDKPTGGNLLYTGNTYTTQFLTNNTSYYVQTLSGTCVSPTRTEVDVVVNPVPTVTSAATGAICSGTAQNYAITADLAGSTFKYSRAAVAGISNAAVTNQPASSITETLINTAGTNISVKYIITPTLNGCDGPPFDYVVTVNPAPTVTSSSTGLACSGTAVNYIITFNTTGTPVSWSRARVAGISNAPVSNQISNQIQEALVNTSNAPVDVDYTFTYGTASCSVNTFKYTATVNPKVVISSSSIGNACSGAPQNYVITSQVPSAKYSWTRAAVAGISNPTTTVVSNVIDETLVNTTTREITVYYTITTVSNGCQPKDFLYTVTVYPQPPKPVANSNSPVCTGNTIKLLTPTIVAGTTYLWTGPNGFKSTQQNPVITKATAANQGQYKLYLLSAECTSVADTVNVLIDAYPVANAGPDIVACNTATSVPLAGSISGGTNTGLWSTSGTGTFNPSAASLNGTYLPSAQDLAKGAVKLTLSSASKDDCSISTDDVTITFTLLPSSDAGTDQLVCSQDNSIALSGKMLAPYSGTWSTNGTGTFSPSATQIADTNPVYILSAADKKMSSIKFKLTLNSTDPCYLPSDSVTYTFAPPPTVDAGPTKFLLKGNTTTLTPRVSDNNVTYQWRPATGLSSTTEKNPVVTGDVNTTYFLTVTDSRGCISATDSVNVIIAPQISVTNTFTPNGDGINDYWDIPGLIAYINATVDIFDRNGQKVFHSIGYSTPFDGTYNGKRLPFGTYYYVIDPKLLPIFSGFVTIVK